MTPQERQAKRESVIVRYMTARPLALYDIGVGPKTEWKTLKGFFPEMETFGVEANPNMVETILANGWEGPLLNRAVFSSRGEMTIKVYRSDGLDASVLKIPGRKVFQEFTVETVTLDDADNYFGNCDHVLLWMDIEGAELAALMSGPQLMKSERVKWINLEVRGAPPWEGGCSADEVDEHLRSLRYRKVVDYNMHENSGHYDTIYFHDSVDVNLSPKPSDVPA